jgi:hypothetical protein
MFTGYAFGTYHLNDSARCEKGRGHEAPSKNCQCGFYAMKTRDRAEYLLERWRSLVLLKVEFYGRIIEHRDGLRAEEQEVTTMFIPRRCSKGWCPQTTEGMRQGRRHWRTVCSMHLRDGLTLGELRSLLKLDVVLLDPLTPPAY